ncbi:MAG: nucleoside triphosphate pyrophosphohydrolase [Verrucomicrobiaceae bacterium]|nr:nucleoside triphosphate pyrophosphohydrolase [Verrucomicrobiaceae bacterium]
MPHEIPSPDLPLLDRLRRIMHLLRAPGGCPWDAEQTHESLVKHLIEEAYEVAAAIRGGNREEIIDELGDLLLQPVFHGEIASGAAEGAFDLDDIAAAICEKLIRRHPHVFGETTADTPEAVLRQWDSIKAREKDSSGPDESGSSAKRAAGEYLIKKANDGLPALMAAGKIQRKAAAVGFDWPDLPPVIEKVREELEEVEEALDSGCGDKVAEEIGDLLFAVVNLARRTGHEAELLLHAANGKFVERLQAVEEDLRKSGRDLRSATLEEMDAAWENVKRQRSS